MNVNRNLWTMPEVAGISNLHFALKELPFQLFEYVKGFVLWVVIAIAYTIAVHLSGIHGAIGANSDSFYQWLVLFPNFVFILLIGSKFMAVFFEFDQIIERSSLVGRHLHLLKDSGYRDSYYQFVQSNDLKIGRREKRAIGNAQ